MKTFFGIVSGFLMISAFLGLMAFWVWLMVKFDVSKSDFVIGAALAIAVLIISIAVAVKLLPH